MFLKLFLTICLFLGLPDVSRGHPDGPSEGKLPQDTVEKINDLWMTLIFPHYEERVASNWTAYASCAVKPSDNLELDKPQVTGQVLFRQAYPNGKLEVIFSLDGFPIGTNSSGRAIHVHQYGDLSNSCDSAGGHYNPLKEDHPRHPGDFGNFYPREGKIRRYRSIFMATLFGPYTIIGRSIVIHEQEDDLGKGDNKGSLENGNAGKRLACCVIGTSNKNLWEQQAPELKRRRKRFKLKDA